MLQGNQPNVKWFLENGVIKQLVVVVVVVVVAVPLLSSCEVCSRLNNDQVLSRDTDSRSRPLCENVSCVTVSACERSRHRGRQVDVSHTTISAWSGFDACHNNQRYHNDLLTKHHIHPNLTSLGICSKRPLNEWCPCQAKPHATFDC